MNLDALTTSVESALEAQLRFASDGSVAEAGQALITALGPALRDAGMQLARQAADEVGAQLPDHEVEVVLDGDDPSLRVTRTEAEAQDVDPSDLDARITLRLPTNLKQIIEEAADLGGDSVNTYVVKTLSGSAKTKADRKSGNTLKGRFDL